MNAFPLLHQLRARHAPAQERIARRRALELIGTAGAALVAACKAGGLPAHAPELGARRVAIVGGGCAGLLCAAQLCWAGYDAMVFEARERLGGRVSTLTDFAPGKPVEAGADFISAQHRTWIGLAQVFKLELVDAWPGDLGERPVVLGGRRLDSTESAHLFEELSSLTAQLTALASDVDADEPWRHASAPELDARSVDAWIEDARPSDLARAALRAQLESTSGVAPRRMSLLALLAAIRGGGLDEYWTQSQRLRCKGGNGQLVHWLEKRVGASRRLLDAPVRTIRAVDGGYEIVLRSGERYRCADVVLAVPPATWSRIEIDPPLPRELAPQSGTRLKLLAGFRERSFGPAQGPPSFLGDGLVQASFDPLAHDPHRFVHVLACVSGGDAAARWAGIVESQRRAELGLRELDLAWPGTSLADGGIRWCDWSRDPWSLCACSFAAPGELTRSGPLLRAGHAGIRFAGEHTSSACPGTMEGALQSGQRVATELCRRDGVRRES